MKLSRWIIRGSYDTTRDVYRGGSQMNALAIVLGVKGHLWRRKFWRPIEIRPTESKLNNVVDDFEALNILGGK